jgi:hypothetical protein
MDEVVRLGDLPVGAQCVLTTLQGTRHLIWVRSKKGWQHRGRPQRVDAGPPDNHQPRDGATRGRKGAVSFLMRPWRSLSGQESSCCAYQQAG